MHRLLGKKKQEVKGPSLEDVTTRMGAREEDLKQKINKLDQELLGYKRQLKTAKTPSARNTIMKRVKQTMQRKRMYEKQLDTLAAQSFNIEQTQFATETIKESAETVNAMKGAAATLKAQFKDVDMDAIDDLQDDMDEMLELSNEVQEAMGRTYGVPDEIDEDELLGELDALGEELDMEAEMEADAEIPSYMISAAAAAKKPERVTESEDEFGLPKVPVRNLMQE